VRAHLQGEDMQRGRVTALVVAAVVAVAAGGALVLADEQGTLPPRPELPSSVAGDLPSPITEPPEVRIAVAGDTGTADSNERATAQRMVAEEGSLPYDALLLLGDLIYEVGDVDLVDEAILEPFAPLTEEGTELLPALGNHDYGSDEQDEIMTALGRGQTWYLDRVGPVRVVVLDSNIVDDIEQTEWLERILAKPQPADTWTLVALHHPPYSAGEHGSSQSVRDAWVPLFEQYDVPLVLAGHDHDYQRSVAVNDVTYVVSGAGAKVRPTGQEDFTAVSSSTLHFLDLLVYRDRIVGRAIDHSGELVDEFTLRQ
jgi:3',5'-cyclic AMP phosphodiesterase CpdA